MGQSMEHEETWAVTKIRSSPNPSEKQVSPGQAQQMMERDLRVHKLSKFTPKCDMYNNKCPRPMAPNLGAMDKKNHLTKQGGGVMGSPHPSHTGLPRFSTVIGGTFSVSSVSLSFMAD